MSVWSCLRLRSLSFDVYSVRVRMLILNWEIECSNRILILISRRYSNQKQNMIRFWHVNLSILMVWFSWDQYRIYYSMNHFFRHSNLENRRKLYSSIDILSSKYLYEYQIDKFRLVSKKIRIFIDDMLCQ